MPDLLSWSFPVGRWRGTTVRLHVLFLVWAVFRLLEGALKSDAAGRGVVEAAAWVVLLLVVLLLHELGHAFLSARVGVDREEIRLWPLGNFVGPSGGPLSRTREGALIAATGPLMSLALALGTAAGLGMVGVRMEFNPFGGENFGAPLLGTGKPASPLSAVWWLGAFGYLNWVVCLANLLIPALPFDMGRVMRGLLGGSPRETELSPYLARASAVVLGLVALFRLYFNRPGWLTLLGLALLVEWMARLEARQLEESGYFDEGLFGYDFSQGYTSLDAGPSTVRPKKESGLRRWRRRRSETRRLRREAQEAAEAARTDEILAKLHREGRAALTDEEHRFLLRVSAHIRRRKGKGR
jgi:stage IV sporulation protein FB